MAVFSMTSKHNSGTETAYTEHTIDVADFNEVKFNLSLIIGVEAAADIATGERTLDTDFALDVLNWLQTDGMKTLRYTKPDGTVVTLSYYE